MMISEDEKMHLLAPEDDAENDEKAAINNQEIDVVDNLKLRVKTSSETPVLVQLLPTATVSDLKKLIASQIEAVGKRLRLIYQGKLLSNDEACLQSYNIQDNGFIHCVVSEPKLPQAQDVGCVEQIAEATDALPSENRPLRGFDRLRSSNLTAEDIQALRLHFFPQVAAMIAEDRAQEGETAEERIFRVEEEWMAQQGPSSEFAMNVRPRSQRTEETRIDMGDELFDDSYASSPEGTMTDFFWGMFMGLILGVILTFWLWERSVPRKQKAGILCGVVAHITLNTLRSQMV